MLFIKRHHSPVRKVVTSILVSAIGLYLLVTLPINLLLVTHYFPWLVSEGEGKSFNLTYRMAWSWIPGRVRLSHLELEGVDPNVHWKITLDHLLAQFDLRGLLRKEVIVTHVRADQIRVNVQEHPPGERAEIIAKLREGETEKPNPHPWRIVVRRADLQDIHSVSIDSYSLKGSTDVAGTFTLTPGRHLDVDGIWNLHNDQIRTPEALILTDVNGLMHVRIHPTELEYEQGTEIFKTIDAQVAFHSHVFDAQVFGLLLRPYKTLRFGKTVGQLDLVSSVKRGTILPGTQLRASLKDLDLFFSGASMHAMGNIHWKVSNRDGSRALSTLDLGLKDLTWKGDSHLSAPLAFRAKASIHGLSRELSLVDPFTDLDMWVNFRDHQIGKIQDFLNHFSDRKDRKKRSKRRPLLTSHLGHFELTGRIRPNRKWFRGKARYSTDEIRFSHDGGSTVLKGGMESQVSLESANYEKQVFGLAGARIRFNKISILKEGHSAFDTSKWEARLELQKGQVAFPGSNFAVDGDLAIQLTNAKIPVKYAKPDNFWVSLALLLFPMNDFRGNGHLSVVPEGLALTDFKAHSSSGDIAGSFVEKDGVPRFTVLVGVLPLNLCFDYTSVHSHKISVISANSRCVKAGKKIEDFANFD